MGKSFNLVEFDLPDMETKTVNDKRHYITPDGNLYPSVTTVVGAGAKVHIDAWRKRIGEKEADKISTQARLRGEELHLMCEHYLKNDPDYAKAHNHLTKDLFRPIQKVLDHYVDDIYGLEVPLYSDVLKLAGRVDVVGSWKFVPSIIDFKTSKYKKKEEWIQPYFQQATAYAIMVEERTGMKIENIILIIACEFDNLQVIKRKKSKYVKDLYQSIEEYNQA